MTLVIGVGNRDRGDDGVGPAVVDELRRRGIPVETVIREGDLADLAVVWRGHDDVVIVDACRSGRPVGTVEVIDPTDAVPAAPWSTHGLGVAEGVELARRLGRLPRSLRIVGVQGTRFDPGPLSPELRSALAAVVDRVAAVTAAAPSR